MKNLDEQIRNALSPDDATMLGGPEDGLRIDQLAFSTLRSRNWFVTGMMILVSFIVMGLSIWCAIRFYHAQETKELLSYGFGFLLGMFMISFMKVWFWLEMQRIAITREVKKVELLTARMLQELNKHSPAG